MGYNRHQKLMKRILSLLFLLPYFNLLATDLNYQGVTYYYYNYYSAVSNGNGGMNFSYHTTLKSGVNASGVITIPSVISKTVSNSWYYYVVDDTYANAFANNQKITQVTINAAIDISDLFSNCYNLNTITIGKSVKNLSSYSTKGVFPGCPNLLSINVEEGNPYFTAKSGMLLNKNGNTLIAYPAAGDSLYIATDIKNIAPGGLSSIRSCFIHIPETVDTIGSYAFANDTALKSIVIPSSLKHIGNNAFIGCLNLNKVYYEGTVEEWMQISFEGDYSNPCSNGADLFIQSKLVDTIDTEDVLIINSYAFDGCSSLQTVYINENLRQIKNDAFKQCSNLTSVYWNAINCHDFTSSNAPFRDVQSPITFFTFGSNVEHIPAYLCGYLSSVNNIIIPCSVKSIGENAFNQSIDLTRECGIIHTSETYLTLCEGEKCFWGNKNIPMVKPSDSGDYTYKTKSILYDDSIATLHLIVYPTYNIILPDTTLCYGEELIIDGVQCDIQKMPNIRHTWTRNLQTTEGCDSIISISVLWKRVAPLSSFNFTVKDEFDKPNSGSISWIVDENTDYKYDYYTINGQKNASTYSLTSGAYRLVFYSEECGDSIVKNITIDQYGMKVNGMYYLLNENNHTAILTYRGTSYDDYNGEYSGNITIPKKITFDGNEYQVTGIDYSAFSGCNNISSITMESETPISMYSSGLSYNCIIYVPFGSLNAYKSASGWSYYNIHVINPSHATTTTAATSAKITLGNTDEAKHISSCGMEGGEEEFAGNVIEYIGLEPNSEYANVPLFIKTKEGDIDNTTVSFTTSALELTTKPSKPVSSTTAILLAETNMSDAEVNCGFEWKRNDAPADMEGNKVYCPVASGQMAGRLKGLKDDVYYKYRAFYQSAAGNMYYGDWQYIFTGDVAVEFDPILYTYGATVVRENEATISGYALAGSEDFTEQGFEYWAESRTNSGANAPHRVPAALNEHFFVQASGIALRATLTNLDAGTVYKYRVYGKVGDQYYYGAEQAFTTTGTYTPPTYTITFVNWDGSELQSSQVTEDNMPQYTGEMPERPADEQYTYTFSNWTPEIAPATEDATYTAIYTTSLREYLVTFLDEDGTEISSQYYKYGETPVAPADPVKESTDEYVYIFIGWSPAIVSVTADATYTATYEANSREGVNNIYLDPQAQKILINGQVLIQRGDKLYTLTGQEVK